MNPISTPCIKLCIMDESSGLCQGCGRTLDEIGSWASLEAPTRFAIMVELPGRLARSREARLAAAGRRNRRRATRPVS